MDIIAKKTDDQAEENLKSPQMLEISDSESQYLQSSSSTSYSVDKSYLNETISSVSDSPSSNTSNKVKHDLYTRYLKRSLIDANSKSQLRIAEKYQTEE